MGGLLGVVERRYIDFLILYLSLLLLYLFFFAAASLLFVHKKKVFRSYSGIYLFLIKFYVLNNFFTQYKHTYGRLRASHGSYMKATHNVLYIMKKHIQRYASYPGMDISCITSRSAV